LSERDKTIDYILYTIDRLPKGYVFTYTAFVNEVKKKETLIKALKRMAATRKLTELSKGSFYKPETSVFGVLQPQQYQIVKDILEVNRKIVGYLTGYVLYNQLG
jgi:hypothetical protein